MSAMRCVFPEAYFASCYSITERAPPEAACCEVIQALNSDELLVGSSRFRAGGWSIKLLARDSAALHLAVISVRETLSSSVPALRSSTRRV